MAGGPYSDSNGNKYIVWSFRGNQVRESLKTKKSRTAKKRKSTLEQLHRNGKHKPQRTKWYYNESISPIVYSGRYELESEYAGSITMETLKDRYITYKKRLRGKKGWGQKRRQNVPYILDGFVKSVGIMSNADDIDEFDIQDFLYRPKIHSDHTRQTYLRAIKAMFNWGTEKGLTTNKVDYQANAPKNETAKFLTRNEIIDICYFHLGYNWNNLHKHFITKDNSSKWMIYAWLLMASTGMRPNEIMHLKLEDIADGYLIVNARQPGKTRASRTVRYLRWTKQVLAVLCDPEVRASDRYMKKSTYLFGRESKQSQNRLSSHFTNARKDQVPNKDLTLYNLRDSFAVWYLTNETELSDHSDRRLYDLMRILGHSKITTTQTYLKAIPPGLKLL